MKILFLVLGMSAPWVAVSGQDCLRGNCINGFGTMLYTDGSKYTGEFRQGMREGKGLYYYANKNKFLGEWKKDLRWGEGKMEFTNGDVYTGSFANNQMQGMGTMDFGRGDKYIGQWANNKPNGKGNYYFKSGERYEGDFVNALFEGQGTLFYKSGSFYAGGWKGSKKEGEGAFHDAHGKVVYAHWANDKLAEVLDKPIEQNNPTQNQTIDPGTQTNTTAPVIAVENVRTEKEQVIQAEEKNEEDSYFEKLFGTQKEDQATDTVSDNAMVSKFFGEEPQVPVSEKEQVTPNERVIEEQAHPVIEEKPNTQIPEVKIDNVPNPRPHTVETKPETTEQPESFLPDCNTSHCASGQGFFKYGDGSKYIGEFFQGEPLGKGICYYSNGDRYEGFWKNHAPNGEGIMYFASGLIYGAIWENGKAIKELSRKKEFVFDPNVPVDEDDEVKIWAVIIGIARYEHMPVLKYSDDDAYKIYAFLKSPEGGALKDNQIRVLIDEDANRTSILTALNQVFMRADENDVVMLYYSGHGLEGTFLPIDYDGFQNILKHDEVKEIINRSKAKNKICFIDACHSGSLLATKGSFSSSLLYFYDKLGQSSGGTAFIMSSKSKEYSLEDGGLRQGVFSHFLIRGLKGEADVDRNKTIQLKELFEYVYRNVRDYTGNAQSPMIAGDYDEQMPVGFIREE